ncbi:hypothetical protein LX81_03262 [Palleronia aestuarii]|uniref:Uncharacterized protein n=1 Tax=Palleronia aestuarii TaxID=568105 RepID=A0A2W7N578_9RHOB|nr:hypothetical protein [Palleronia aestuarii]PZX13477.1 hypothetical protein LX81_03262 [Palleronia aestuarii]
MFADRLRRALRRMRGAPVDMARPVAEGSLVPIHAVVISWAGRGAEAQAIAAALGPAVERLTVIYSNHEGVPETGAGDWVGVPQDWYYGRKFAESLRRHRGEALMLQVQADAGSPDWPGLVDRLRAAHAACPDLGVWAPEVHVSPYRLQTALLGRRSGALHDAAQTDGVVWALSRPVLDRLAALDYAGNDLGWGIDWTAFAIARSRGHAVLCDTGLTVSHPPARGYSENAAEAQMAWFLAQLDPAETAWRLWSQALVRTRKRARRHATGRWPLGAAAETAELAAPALRGAIAEIRVGSGRVLVRGAPDLDRQGVRLRAGLRRRPLVPLDKAPDIRAAPRLFDLAPHRGETHALEVEPPGPDGEAGPPLARLEIRAPGPLSVPLGPPLTLPGGTGDLELAALLAADAPGGALVLHLAPCGEGPPEGPPRIAIEIGGAGGIPARIAQWQPGFARIPGAARPRRAELRLECSGAGPESPARLCAAGPHIVSPAAQPDLVWPRRIAGGYAGPCRWFVAETGPLGPRSRLAIGRGDARADLLPPAPGLSARIEAGTLHVTAPAGPAMLGVWLDGVAAFALALDGDQARLALPPDPRPGGGRLELRDATGTRILWRSRTPRNPDPRPVFDT